MAFDGTITLGAVLQIVVMIVAIIVAWMKLDSKLTSFSVNLEHHASAIEKHTIRLDVIDSKFIDVISKLERLIGRTEGVDFYRTTASNRIGDK